MYNYGDCHTCGGTMRERRIKQDLWIKGKLVVVEGVPAGVCPQCGERIVKGDVGRSILALIGDSTRLRKARMMNVPVLRFAKKIA